MAYEFNRNQVDASKEVSVTMLTGGANSPSIDLEQEIGGDIEAVAAATPELIFKEPFNLKTGPSDEALERLAVAMGFDLPDTVKV